MAQRVKIRKVAIDDDDIDEIVPQIKRHNRHKKSKNTDILIFFSYVFVAIGILMLIYSFATLFRIPITSILIFGASFLFTFYFDKIFLAASSNYKCPKCGMTFYSRDSYEAHNEVCLFTIVEEVIEKEEDDYKYKKLKTKIQDLETDLKRQQELLEKLTKVEGPTTSYTGYTGHPEFHPFDFTFQQKVKEDVKEEPKEAIQNDVVQEHFDNNDDDCDSMPPLESDHEQEPQSLLESEEDDVINIHFDNIF